MTGQSPGTDNTKIRQLMDQLACTVERIDQDDLNGLAKMHEWCQELASTCSVAGQPPWPAVTEQSALLTANLEALILGEVEDAARAFAGVVESVAALSRAFAAAGGTGRSPADEPPVSMAQAAAETPDAQVKEKLAKVFEEPALPEGGEPDAGAADDTTAATPDDVDAAEPDGTLSESASPATGSVSASPAAEAAPALARYEQSPLTLSVKEMDFLKGFVEEAGEHIQAIESAVLEVEQAPDDTDKINDLFRPFHTIKGLAGFLNLRDINCLTHETETLLDQGRKGQRQITPGLIDTILDVVDILKVQIGAVGAWVAQPHDEPVPQPPVGETIEQLREMVAGRRDPESRQNEPGSAAQRVGENLVDQGAVAPEAVDYALAAQKTDKSGRKLGEILIDSKVATTRQVSRAIRAQQPDAAGTAAGEQKAVVDQSIRIDTAKLDALVDMVGELVIAQTLVSASSLITEDPKLTKDVGQVTKIVREVQEVAMAMRMVPIGPTFRKMARLVRDVSRKAGKQVNLVITGEDTELDKTVIQQIGDPLVHMVRNAVDHGVESPEARQAAGKPAMGEVRLAARHHGGSIVIEVADDGKGLDPEKLLAKAISKGIVQPGEELSEQQIHSLIFAPGFSTAEVVTDISGRGVGMDVVRRNIEQLRGKVDIASEKGHGSTFSIRLPLTLAIIDGMIVKVGGERFILPTITIEQSLRPLPEQITTVQHRGEVLNLRGQLTPLIQLGQIFGLTGRVNPCEAMVVIARADEQRMGLVVEELIGQQQVVIKSLGDRFQGLSGISGAAILGDGKVGLILDTTGLGELHQRRHAPGARARASAAVGSETARQAGKQTAASEPEMSAAEDPAPAAC